MSIELLVQHENNVYMPNVLDGITWTTERKNAPGQLDFKVIVDEKLNISEGNAVRFKVDNNNIFYGFIFKLKRDKEKIISITAYDQLRYLKNKDTYVYGNKTASELIKMIAEDFKLQTGEIEDTGFKITSRIEDNTPLFDIIENALDITFENKKSMYVFYDDFGKLRLKSLENMKVDILIDEETAENYEYISSIDEDTYNKIKLIYDNEETGKREIYIAQSSENINKWGILQYFDILDISRQKSKVVRKI